MRFPCAARAEGAWRPDLDRRARGPGAPEGMRCLTQRGRRGRCCHVPFLPSSSVCWGQSGREAWALQQELSRLLLGWGLVSAGLVSEQPVDMSGSPGDWTFPEHQGHSLTLLPHACTQHSTSLHCEESQCTPGEWLCAKMDMDGGMVDGGMNRQTNGQTGR